MPIFLTTFTDVKSTADGVTYTIRHSSYTMGGACFVK